MRILITGGAGFIGRHLAPQLLERGHDVTIVDRLAENVHGPSPQLPAMLTERCRFVRGDVRTPETWDVLDEAAPEVIVHLAAETGVGQSMYEVGRYTDVNIQGTAVMLDQLRRHGTEVRHLVLASSRAVYGEGSYRCESCGVVTPRARTPQQLEQGRWEPPCPSCGGDIDAIATAEDAPRVPTSVYAMTKAAQEDLLSIVAPTLGATLATLRYGNVYGEGQPLTNPYTGVLSAFALRLMRGEAPKVYEDGRPTRDFVHVSDVAAATALACEAGTDLLANVGSGERWTLHDIAVEQAAAFGAPVGVEVTGQYRVGDIRGFQATTDAMEKYLGYRPTVGLTDGLSRFARWVREEAEVPATDVASKAEDELRQAGLQGTAGRATGLEGPGIANV